MMRVAIAGGGGFAWILAREIQLAETAITVLVLSSREHADLEPLGAQVAVVDYSNVEELRYTLQGVDVVVSIVSGRPQLNLIDAAHRARVQTFVPSEFEGALAQRPTPHDPLGRGSEEALGFLQQCSQPSRTQSHAMRFTVFSCGVFYERFAPGGLAMFNIGTSHNVQNPGDYLVNIANATAEIVELDAHGVPAMVSMTSVYDVARYVVAAIDAGPENWPREFRMRGDHMSVRDILRACESIRNVPFDQIVHEYCSIPSQLGISFGTGNYTGNWQRWNYFQQLLATANGRYDLGQANLNEMVDAKEGERFVPERFVDWLRRIWSQPLPRFQADFQSTTMQID